MMTKTEKKKRLQEIRQKAVKLYIDGLMSTKDVEAISKITEKYLRQLK